MPVQSLREINHWNAIIIDATSPTIPDVKPSGIITDLDCPVLSRDFDTTKRAGEVGEVPRVKHFKATEINFTVKNTYAEFLAALAKGMVKDFTLKVTACIVGDDSTVIPYIITGKGFIGELPLGSLSADGLESEINMQCYYVTATLGATAIVFDPRNYVFSINGVNQFADVKTLLYPADVTP